MQRNKNRLGQLNLDNLISFWPEAEEGKPNVIIEHTVDNRTLWALGGITFGTAILTFTLNKLF